MRYERQTIAPASRLSEANAFWDKALAMAELGDQSMLKSALVQAQKAETAFLMAEQERRSRATKWIVCDEEDPVTITVNMQRETTLRALKEIGEKK